MGKLFKTEVLEDKINENSSLNNLSSLNTLSMMLETEAGSGDYTLENRSSWPTKDDGYVFNETLSKCENGSKLSWNEETSSVVMKGSISDKCYAYFDVAKPDILLADWVKEQYAAQTAGSETIYLHDENLENGAGDNSYRYSGLSEDVNNYVCFGSDEETCPHDNLYRIIGVFDNRTRLIKADYATSAMLGTDTGDYKGVYSHDTLYYQGESSNLTNIAEYHWNNVNYDTSYNATGYYNDWSYSELNKTHLNKNYINYLDNINTKWANMIDTTEWKVGGFASEDKEIPSTVYTNEIISPSDQVTSTYKSKIGLMYVSDYGFAASPSAWTTTLRYYSGNDTSGNKITEENWMYMGLFEYTISRSSTYSFVAGIVNFEGLAYIGNEVGGIDLDALAVRPVFHLLSSIKYVSGSGEKNSPIRIN